MIVPSQRWFRKSLTFGVQLVALGLLKVMFLPRVRREYRGLELAGNCLIAANHRRMTDALIICGCLPFGIALRLLPFAFITADIYYDSWLRPVLWLAGCYPARNLSGRHKSYGIDASVGFLRHGWSMLIFPEGKRIRSGERGAAYAGILKIHQAAATVPVAICHIEYTGRQARVVLATLRQVPDTADAVMDEVYKLGL